MFFGESYNEGMKALMIISIGIAFNVSVGSTGTLLQSIGNSRHVLLADIFGVVTNIILNIHLVPSSGIEGAAIATALSLFVRNLITVIMIYYSLKFIPFRLNFVITFLICTTLFIISTLVRDFILEISSFSVNEYYIISYELPIGHILYITGSLVLLFLSFYSYHVFGFLDEEDYNSLSRIIRKIRGNKF